MEMDFFPQNNRFVILFVYHFLRFITRRTRRTARGPRCPTTRHYFKPVFYYLMFKMGNEIFMTYCLPSLISLGCWVNNSDTGRWLIG
jgi:hypothetical protein